MRKKTIIPVFLILILTWLGSLYYLDNIVKMATIRLGESVFRAKVDVGDASIQFSPFRVTLYQIDVADKNAPMKNLFSLESAELGVQFLPLLSKKILIDTIEVVGFSQGSQRQKSGALVLKQAPTALVASTVSRLKKPDIDLGSLTKEIKVEMLVDPKDLAISKATDRIVEDIQLQKAQLKTVLDTTSTQKEIIQLKDSLRAFESEASALSTLPQIAGFLSKMSILNKRFNALSDSIISKKTKVKQLLKSFEKSKKDLSNVSKQDYSRIVSKLSKMGFGDVNVTGLLFSDTISLRLAQLSRLTPAIKTVLKLLSSDSPKGDSVPRGEFVQFKNTQPIPSFWVKKVRLSSNKKISLLLENLSSDPDIIDRPLTFRFTRGTFPVYSFLFSGQLDTRQSQFKTNFEYALRNIALSNYPIYASNDKQIRIQTGQYDLTGTATFQRDALNTTLVFTGSQLKFGFENIADTPISLESLMKGALSDLNNVSVTGSITGSLSDPNIQLHSGIDVQLNARLQSVVKKQTSALNRQVRKYVRSQLNLNKKRLLQKTRDYDRASLEILSSSQTELAQLRSRYDSVKSVVNAKGEALSRNAKSSIQKEAKKGLGELKKLIP